MKLVTPKLVLALAVGEHVSAQSMTSAIISYKLQNAILDLSAIVLDDSSFTEELFQHGCWCAKISSDNPVGLGGNQPVDQLDQICKEWAKARRCTRQEGSSCETQDSATSSYELEYDLNGGDSRDYLCPEGDGCLGETCQIDIYYLKEILDWKNAYGNGFTAISPNSCPVGLGGAPMNCESFQLMTERPKVVSSFTWEDVKASLASVVDQIPFQVNLGEFKGPTPLSGNLAELNGAIVEEDKNLTGALPAITNNPSSPGRKKRQIAIPEHYDPRNSDINPNCHDVYSIVRDQAGCGSCWAFASVGVTQDVVCAQSEGRHKQLHSPMQIAACCDFCRTPQTWGQWPYGHWGGTWEHGRSNMCSGGVGHRGLMHFIFFGTTTGNDAQSSNDMFTGMNRKRRSTTSRTTRSVSGYSQGCYPYDLYDNPDVVYSDDQDAKATCRNTCVEESGLNWDEDLIGGLGEHPNGDMGIIGILTTDQMRHHPMHYSRVSNDLEELVQRTIMMYGSMVVNMEVYENFYAYESGVYEKTWIPGSYGGRHLVRLIGWGREDGKDYWLCANSWGDDWGDRGFFKIRRGTNEADMDSDGFFTIAYTCTKCYNDHGRRCYVDERGKCQPMKEFTEEELNRLYCNMNYPTLCYPQLSGFAKGTYEMESEDNEPETPEPPTPETSTPEPSTPETPTPEPPTPETPTPEPSTPATPTPTPETPEPSTPETPQTPTSETPEPVTPVTPECVTLAGSWGDVLICPENFVVVGICGSGNNADCGGYYHKIKCCRANTEYFDYEDVNPDDNALKCGWVTHQAGHANTIAPCPENTVLTGRCGSGKTADCRKSETVDDSDNGGHFGLEQIVNDSGPHINFGTWPSNGRNWHAGYCCEQQKSNGDVGDVGNGDDVWRKGWYGETIQCPNGYVVVESCGSGEFAGCQDVGPQGFAWMGFFSTAIQCKQWKPAININPESDNYPHAFHVHNQ